MGERVSAFELGTFAKASMFRSYGGPGNGNPQGEMPSLEFRIKCGDEAGGGRAESESLHRPPLGARNWRARWSDGFLEDDEADELVRSHIE